MVDVARAPQRLRERVSKTKVTVALMLLALLTGVALLRPAVPTVESDGGTMDTVRVGVFTRTVRAAGVLVPERIQWISALSPGRVERIMVAPGQTVEPNALLMELTNPDVTMQVLEAERQLGAAQAALVSLGATLETQNLTQQAALATLRSIRAEATRQARAKEELAKSSVIAPMEVEFARDQAKELDERVTIEQKRKAVLSQAALAQLSVQRSEIGRLRAIVAFQQGRETALRVRTPVAGVVQDVLHEPGQWVNPGEVLAKVVSPDRLKAVLRVPEADANGLSISQPVVIDMRTATLRGRITRVDPGVQGGIVRVDVTLDDKLPDAARPDLTVDGAIEVERASNVLHVARPPHVQPATATQVFRVARNGDEAERVTVRVGRVSANSMEVISGLRAGDVILLLDPTDVAAPRIRLKR